jgi:hypothetical protein
MVGCHRHGEAHSHLSDSQLVKGLAHGVFVLEDLSGRSVTHDTAGANCRDGSDESW